MRVGRFHGSAVPEPVIASGSSMLLEFTSDGSIVRQGFHATFSCGAPGPPPPPPSPPTLACSVGAFLDDEGFIDFYDGHGHGEDCRWTAVCSAGSPQIEFTEFNTEPRYDTAFALSFHCLRG